MTRQTKRCLWIALRTVSAAACFLLFLGGSSAALASGESDSGGVAAAATAAIRTSPVKRSRKRLAEERAMARALSGKRDPFKAPRPPRTSSKRESMDGPLPPGVHGLLIGQLRLKGIVREEGNHTMIAVVANRSNLAYFLHIHEDVYNGVVSRITPNAIYFQKTSLDSGGRIVAREVVLKLGSGPQEAR